METSKPKVMILGTFHLKPTPDMNRVEFDTISNQKRQDEIRKVVESIKEFKPTKLAFEVVKEKNDALNEDYRNYLNGQLELKVDEIHQFGFRAASELGHQEIYAVDWRDNIGQRGFGEVCEWAENEQPELIKFINDKYPEDISKLVDDNIFETIRRINDEKVLTTLHEIYMNVGRIGKGVEYVGIDWLKWWYQRNLIIYSNIANLISSLDDRILLLIGGSHVYLVAQFLRESGLVEVEPAHKYLT